VIVSATPGLIDAMVSAARASSALAGVTVYDGPGISDDPGDFLMIGVDDPDEHRRTHAAEASQTWANRTDRDESGDITCAAVSSNGDADQKAARDAVYAMARGLADLCRPPNDPSFGVAGVLWTSYGTQSFLSQAQDSRGAGAQLIFTIHYRARL